MAIVAHKDIERIRISSEGKNQARVIGAGRSGVVYLERDPSSGGTTAVSKIFGGDTASRIVLYALTGAPNPYVWCEAAVRSAEYRRRIMTFLVQYWFKDQLQLPHTFGTVWSDTHKGH